jgi:hypothetical protein
VVFVVVQSWYVDCGPVQPSIYVPGPACTVTVVTVVTDENTDTPTEAAEYSQQQQQEQ